MDVQPSALSTGGVVTRFTRNSCQNVWLTMPIDLRGRVTCDANGTCGEIAGGDAKTLSVKERIRIGSQFVECFLTVR